ELVVDPFPLPPRERLPAPERLAANPAVRLFVERARAARADFALAARNPRDPAGVCRRLGGLPPAIGRAAARARAFPRAALRARLDRRLDLSASGARDLPARQQTLRAAIAWSYDLLPPAQRRLFERICVFVGSFGLRAAEAICSQEPADE